MNSKRYIDERLADIPDLGDAKVFGIDIKYLSKAQLYKVIAYLLHESNHPAV